MIIFLLTLIAAMIGTIIGPILSLIAIIIAAFVTILYYSAKTVKQTGNKLFEPKNTPHQQISLTNETEEEKQERVNREVDEIIKNNKNTGE